MAVSTVAWPVRTTAAAGLSIRDRSSRSSPLTPDVSISATMTSNRCSSMRSNASVAVPAVATRYPAARRKPCRACCVRGSSSTTRIEGCMGD